MAYDWNNLKQQIGNIAGNNNEDKKDERIWGLTRDESGSGTAVIRLLPGKGGNTTPIIKDIVHEIFLKKPNGKWGVYKNPSPSTIERPCPVSDAYMELKNCGIEQYADKLAPKIGRRTKFISNVIVINDLGNPNNNGQIKLWAYGKTVLDQIMLALDPEDQQIQLGVTPKQLFDPLNGEEIVLSVSGKKLDTKYSLNFNPPKPLCDDACVQDIVDNKCWDLTEFYAPERFKDYETLRKEFARAIADTELERALLEIGSNVITQPYSQAPATETASTTTVDAVAAAAQASISQTQSAVQGYTPTQATAPVQETVASVVQNNTAQATAPVQEVSTPVQETVAPTQPAQPTAPGAQDIEALLNTL